MRWLIDANILLDVLQNREPHVRDSAMIWKLCETGQAEGYVSALTVANLVYIMRRELTPEKVEQVMSALMLIFRVAEITASDLAAAARLRWDDFEDALQSVTARRIQADRIITRNVRDFSESAVPAVTPAAWLSQQKE